MTYRIVLFNIKGRRRIIRKGLTLEEAKAWCSRDDTHGDGWFHGFERED